MFCHLAALSGSSHKRGLGRLQGRGRREMKYLAGGFLKTLIKLFSPSTPFRKAKALYACKAEHDSELSFTAGTVFDNGEFFK